MIYLTRQLLKKAIFQLVPGWVFIYSRICLKSKHTDNVRHHKNNNNKRHVKTYLNKKRHVKKRMVC